MSKREAVARYNLIIKKLRKYPASFAEITEYLELESELQEYNFVVSKRTFQRDLDDIRSLYNIDIQYDFSRKVYFIDFDDQPQVNERILEAFDTFNALNITDRLSEYIHFENRRSQGTENLYGLLHAVKNQLEIEFTHQKYWDDFTTHRIVEPYALKEFKNRWYILANDLKDNLVKSFALDRLTELEITKRKFTPPRNFNVGEHFKYCFGIIGPNDKTPSNIVLSFTPHQGKYIKSLPLHESQQVITDNDTEVRVKLKLHITLDLIMELLSFGNNVKVIEPDCLIRDIKVTLRETLKLYS